MRVIIQLTVVWEMPNTVSSLLLICARIEKDYICTGQKRVSCSYTFLPLEGGGVLHTPWPCANHVVRVETADKRDPRLCPYPGL